MYFLLQFQRILWLAISGACQMIDLNVGWSRYSDSSYRLQFADGVIYRRGRVYHSPIVRALMRPSPPLCTIYAP